MWIAVGVATFTLGFGSGLRPPPSPLSRSLA
jgi:hypothetical protein